MQFLKKFPNPLQFIFSLGFFIVMVIILLFLGQSYLHASESGEKIGAAAGTATGWAIGSFEGATKGRAAGIEKGKQIGLQAEDSLAKIEDIVNDIGKLEVLVATVNIENFNKMGHDYAALYLLRGEVVFTVDFEEVFVEMEKDGVISVLFPTPQAELYIDPSEIQKVAEYQKNFFSGSTEAGFIEYLNSLEKINEASKQSITNYKELLKQAEDAAANQIELLIKNLRITDGQIKVEMRQSTQNGRNEL